MNLNYSLEEEEKIKKHWIENGIIRKFLDSNSDSSKKFYFMDGPPYATGSVHMGTALNKILKDIAVKSKQKQGLKIFTRPGYDTHGLPIENKVEQKLGFESKQDILDFGVEKFTAECRKFATQHIDSMSSEFLDLGVWMDWQNPYVTLTNDYIEAIWHTFKKAHEKKLLYQSLYSVHVCTHCETAVAYNEIEYKKTTDLSVYVKFPLKNQKNTFLVVWTTTPWTLPGNLAVMANPSFDYSFVKADGETLIIAKELAGKIMKRLGKQFRIEKTVKGKDLVGLAYSSPLEKHLALTKKENAFRVVGVDERFVGLEEGTGLVHCAPGHGREDFEVGRTNGIKPFCPVSLAGVMTEEAGEYKGMKAKKEADKQITHDLRQDGFLLMDEQYTHDYPFCWRCKNPLLMLATKQWFFKISEIQKKLLAENESTEWNPKWMKDRMRNWLESLGDWPVSRQRFWGSPLPIWICSKCSEKAVFGSLKELKQAASLKEDVELHKPFIDEVFFFCKCGKGVMQRVPEVLDVWFDSGVSSWGALNYPNQKDLFDEFWPADLNIEGTDQVRGWWNSQLICSLIAFDKKPFKRVVTHGMVLDVKKRKMSKSMGNIVMPGEVIEKYNRDYLRFYIAKHSKGQDILFDWSHLKDIHVFFNIFFNTFNFILMYFPDFKLSSKEPDVEKLLPEDKWILTRLFSLSREVLQAYDDSNFFKAIAALEDFVLIDLSRTYIKNARKRTDDESSKQLKETVSFVFSSLLSLISPIASHSSEFLYLKLKSNDSPESIHLQNFILPSVRLKNEQLDIEMSIVRKVTEEVLAIRNDKKLRLRWPLKELVLAVPEKIQLKELIYVLEKQCNVKSLRLEKKFSSTNDFAESKTDGVKIFLNISADSELKKEWELNELIRRIQGERKTLGFDPKEVKPLLIDSDDPEFLNEFRETIEKETNSRIRLKALNLEKTTLIDRKFALKFS